MFIRLRSLQKIGERTREGLNSARARGRKGGRTGKDKKELDLDLKMYEDKKYTIEEISKDTGVGKTTLYRYVKDRK